MKYLIVLVVLLCLSTANANVIQLDGINNSVFNGTQRFFNPFGGSGYITRTNGTKYNLDSHDIAIPTVFSGITDLSSSGIAAAEYAEGDFYLYLYQNWSLVLAIYGTVDNYNENEIGNNLIGTGTVDIVAIVIDEPFWDSIGWTPSTNLCHFTATMPVNIEDYSSNWNYDNSSLTLSTPEPATILLLGIGFVLLKRK